MSVTLYGYWRSLAAFRVRAALNLKSVDYQEISVNLASGEQFEAAFDLLNPQHAVPLLRHDEFEISQSLAILEYIEDQWPTPALLPSNVQDKALVRALALVAIADTHPLIVPRVRGFLNSNWALNEDEQAKWAQHWFAVGNEVIEKILAKGGRAKIYAFGDEITIADIALVSHVIGAILFKVDMSKTPILQSVYSKCMLNAAFANAHPLKQIGAPQTT